mgnify:CR=1 FL=1
MKRCCSDCHHTRRHILTAIASMSFCVAPYPLRLDAQAGQPAGDRHAFFIAEAERMKREAIAAGDQPYGAVLVLDGEIIGYGPSRVVTSRNFDAHAERVALWEAQRRTGRDQLPSALIYSTSPPCSACQTALASATIARMYAGSDARDLGPPRA